MAELVNPKDGELLTVVAGESIDLVLTVTNDNPYENVSFYVVTDLQADWWDGPKENNPVDVPVIADGSLRMTIKPPAGAQPTDYPFKVARAALFGDSLPPIELKLRVTEPAAPEPTVAVEPEPEPQPEPELEPIPIAVDLPPAPPAAPPSAPQPKEPDKPPHDGFVNLPQGPQSGGSESPGMEPPLPLPKADKTVSDPESGQVLPMLPGETMLLTFRFRNGHNQACNYILDEANYQQLPDGWLDRMQSEVNVNPNDDGQVYCMLRPPSNATPGDYHFILVLGEQHAASTIQERMLVLKVQATPAVRIATPKAVESVGPLASSAVFQFGVSSAGNTDTAFRVGIGGPVVPKKTGDDDLEEDYEDVEQASKNWAYCFDQEVGNTKGNNQNRVRLKVERKNPWWWGFKEKHKVKVTAVPVTDDTNGGKTENTTEVEIQRWRLVPVPYRVSILIVMLFLLMAGKANDVHVTNGYKDPNSGTYFVFGNDTNAGDVHVELAWDAMPLLPQRVVWDENDSNWSLRHTIGHGYTGLTDDKTKYGCVKTPGVRGNAVQVQLMPARTKGKLKLDCASSNGVTYVRDLPTPKKIGENGEVTISQREYWVSVPVGRQATLMFRNTSSDECYVNVVRVSNRLENCTMKSESNRQVHNGASESVYALIANELGSRGTLEYATTDMEDQIVIVHVEAVK